MRTPHGGKPLAAASFLMSRDGNPLGRVRANLIAPRRCDTFLTGRHITYNNINYFLERNRNPLLGTISPEMCFASTK
jgi:hypothetical protein